VEEEPSRGEAPAEELPTEELPAEEATPAQSAEETEPTVVPPAEETPSAQPVEGAGDTIAWLEQLAAEKDEKATASSPESKSQLQAEETPAAEPVSGSPDEEDVTITSWLSKLDVEETVGKGTAPSAAQAETPADAQELPDWLKDLEQPAAATESPKADEDLPEWLRQPAEPGETKPIPSEIESEGTSESEAAVASEPETPSDLEPPGWLDENAPVAEQTEPTAPEEWVPAEDHAAGPATEAAAEETKAGPVEQAASPEIAPAVPAAAPVRPSVQPPIIKGTGMLSQVPSQDRDAELFSAAQAALEANSLDEAMKDYGKLIKKGRLLEEVIHDLREAIYRFPVDVIVWQTLGDAYMRANRLQDALDAYTKAEELLR
jgi:hypothetical protein